MSISSDLTILLSPLLEQYRQQSVLLVGDIAINLCQEWQDTRSHELKTPFSLQQLTVLPVIDIAIISEITESLPKQQAIEWLSLLRNAHSQHIILISEISLSTQQGWQLADYLALGMRRVGVVDHYQVFEFAIETYQAKRDWLNSKFWANPENFDKYRW